MADPLRYLCRLLRKVHQAGMSALVCVPPALARELDQALWTFAAEEFILHAGWSADELVQAHTPILIADQAAQMAGRAGAGQRRLAPAELPPGHGRLCLVVEIVGLDDEARTTARGRWRAYAAQGHAIQRHDAAAGAYAG